MDIRAFLVADRRQLRLADRKKRDAFLFLVTPEEETHLKALFAEHRPDLHIHDEWVIDSEHEDLTYVRLGLVGARTLVVSPRVQLESGDLAEMICDAHLEGIRLLDFDSALLRIHPKLSAMPTEVIRNFTKNGIYQNFSRRAYRGIKNILEPVLGGAMMLLLSPLLLIVAAMVKLTSEGPIFYRQVRVGLNGKKFSIIKFRSMRTDAEKAGPVWAAAQRKDSRLSPIGGFLRATHLDELPQLWNILRGQVSFVGPRPERPVFVEELEKDIELFRLRTLVKPGVTGWAQINQGYANTIQDSERKLELDLYYVLRHSLRLDLKVVFGTVLILFRGGSEGKKREKTAAAAPAVESSPEKGNQAASDAAPLISLPH